MKKINALFTAVIPRTTQAGACPADTIGVTKN
jgi:hypothetical protein